MEKVVVKRNLEQLLYDRRVGKINRAYAQYKLEPTDNHLNDLLQLVIKMASRKLRPIALRLGDLSIENEDDFAQKVALVVWEKMLKPDVDIMDNFYAWLSKTVSNVGLHLYRDTIKGAEVHIPLVIEDGDGNMFDNPDAYSVVGASDVFHIQNKDLSDEEEIICYMISDRMTYRQIADALTLDERTIKRRVQNLKARLQSEETQIA